MPNPVSQNNVALIAGPTASGKTGLAIALAVHDPAQKYVIINADSAQIYDHLPILSAHPNNDEMHQAPHRLFGYMDGSKTCSAVSWANDAKIEIKRAHNDGATPILVGGTGLYLRTLLDGIAPIPDIDPEIRTNVRDMDVNIAYEKLQKSDPVIAKTLHPNDRTRIARALEVIQSTGLSIGKWREKKQGGIGRRIDLKPMILLPPRDWLYKRCDRRFLQMLDGGAIHEVETLIKLNPPDDSPLWRAIGVREIKAYLYGEISRAEAIDLGQTATRQYAKRQYTWFRNQSPQHWPTIEQEINFKNLDKIVTLFR